MMKIIGSTLYGVFITALVAVAVLLMGTMLPLPGNYSVKVVKSGSMEPTILTGSVIIVKPADVYAEGDIITFGEDTKSTLPTTHRILSKDSTSLGTLYTTKGDANESADQDAIHEDDIIGKVLFSVPYAGFVLDFARQPLGFTLIIGVPAGIIALEEIGVIVKEIAAMRRRKRNPLAYDQE